MWKYIINILLLLLTQFNILESNTPGFTLTPYMYYDSFSNGSVFHTNKKGSATITTVGLSAKKETSNLSIHGSFNFTSTRNVDLLLSHFDQSLFFEKKRGYYNSDNNWFESSLLSIEYKKTKNLSFFGGKKSIHWGQGNSSLILSKDIPSFPLLGFNWKLSNSLSLEYFHGTLSSQIVDTTNTLYENIVRRNVYYSRSLAGHKLSWEITQHLTFNAMEMVVFGHRTTDIHYLLPLIPFWSMQHYIGDIDNVQMCGELVYKPNSNSNLYFSLFVDEWRPEWTFKSTNRNWFGYQFGLNKNNIFHEKDFFIVEYTWTDHRVYNHKYEINNSYTYDYPIGFWAGPHAEELYIIYSGKIRDLNINIKSSLVKRGELTNEILEGQYKDIIYERYSNFFETRSVTSLKVEKSIINNSIFISCMLENIRWGNPGFDPKSPSLNQLDRVNKTSLNIGLSAYTDIIFK
jgi:hypothetical protein